MIPTFSFRQLHCMQNVPDNCIAVNFANYQLADST